MTFEEALRDIRTHEFAARVGVASDLRTFLRAAKEQESVQTIVHEMASGDSSEERRRHVLCEVVRLSRLQVDFRYQNPWDSALAVLLWALSRLELRIARMAAEAVVQAPQCWWAPKVANHVLQRGLQHDTQATAESNDVVSAGFAYRTDMHNPKTGETILLGDLVHKVTWCLDIQVYNRLDMNLPPEEQAPPAVLQHQLGFIVDWKNQQAAAPQRAERV